MASEQFSLCWDNFHKNMSSGMNSLLETEDLVDVTLAVEGKYLKAHKMVLSVCSPYFKELFKSNPCQHPIVFMKDVSYVAISDLLQFMYQGEVQVSQDNLTTFIKTAEALQIKGLTGDGNGSTDPDSEPAHEKPSARHVEESYKPSPRPKKQLPAPVVTTTPATKRPRLSVSSNDSQSTPAPITKTEPISTAATNVDSAPVQFKVEPYDQNQAVTIPDDGDETFGDDTLDDNTVDDTEDYSMMEGEEPQAGTSTDGTGEGQEHNMSYGAVVHDGFTYHRNSHNVSSNVRYFLCSEYKRLSCKARATVSVRGDLNEVVVNGSHNHPPPHNGVKKAEFIALIKQSIVSQGDHIPLRDIFNSVAELYLTCAELKRSGCRGRATIPLDGNIDLLKMTQLHNHPPDHNAGDRLEFLLELKNTVRAMGTATLKHVYEIVSYKYLKCAMVKELNCKASLVQERMPEDSSEYSYRCLVAHNHPPNSLTLQSSRFMKELEEEIKFFSGSTKELFDKLIERYPEVKQVYTYSNVVGRMHHWLKKYSVTKRSKKPNAILIEEYHEDKEDLLDG